MPGSWGEPGTLKTVERDGTLDDFQIEGEAIVKFHLCREKEDSDIGKDEIIDDLEVISVEGGIIDDLEVISVDSSE